MKILVFSGGLGNQIFGYAFYKYLQKEYPKEKIYGVYNKRKMSDHYGLEINRWFDAQLPQEKWYASLLIYCLYILKKTFGFTFFLDLSQTTLTKKNALVYWAFRLNKKYIPNNNWLCFNINENELSERNKTILKNIRTTNSIFIHVRRGDYKSTKYQHIFEGTCTLDYYKQAINSIKNKVQDPHFFVFSDDISWSKSNLPLEHATFIDWNTGESSPLDMFLMSQCNGAIMANSTFSYWGVRLGVKKHTVCCPKQWYSNYYEDPDLYLENWIKI